MQYVYILKSLKDDNLYIGCTGNVERRFAEHMNGKVSSTRSRRPFRLVHKETYSDKYEAFRKERYYKTPKGKKELKQYCRVV